MGIYILLRRVKLIVSRLKVFNIIVRIFLGTWKLFRHLWHGVLVRRLTWSIVNHFPPMLCLTHLIFCRGVYPCGINFATFGAFIFTFNKCLLQARERFIRIEAFEDIRYRAMSFIVLDDGQSRRHAKSIKTSFTAILRKEPWRTSFRFVQIPKRIVFINSTSLYLCSAKMR